MPFRIKDGFVVGTTTVVDSSSQLLVYQKDTTTIGQNLSKIPDVAGIRFIKINADETVTPEDAATFRTSIGAGTLSAENDTLSSVTGRGATTATAISITNTTASTSTSTGALVVSGGIGVGDGLAVGGILRATSPRFTTGINDSNGNELFLLTATASAVNELTIANAATGNGPTISATGGDANIQLNFTPKGSASSVFTSGSVVVQSNATSTSTTSGALRVAGGAGIGENLNVGGSATIGGNLTVNGTLTSVNSSTVTVDDKNIELGSVATTSNGATLSTGTNALTLTSAVSLSVGQVLTKVSGAGAFGSGTGLTVNTTTAAGAISTATVNAGGTLYSVGDIVTVGGGTGGTLRVTTTSGAPGVVTGVVVVSGGSGYSGATAATTTVTTPAGPWIASVTSTTSYTTNVNHGTAGFIIFNVGGATDFTADGGGLTLKGTTDKTLLWDQTNTNWTSSEHFNLPTGKTYKINNSTVLTNTQVLGKTMPSGSVVGDSDTQTLTNKTFTDSTTTFQDNTDNTKKLQFELSGISTATTRTLTIPNANGSIVLSDATQTLTNKTLQDSTTVFQDNTTTTKTFRLEASGITLGSGATFTVSTNGSGQISAINSTPAVAGSNYSVGDILSIDGPGSPSTKATITVATINSTGGILTFTPPTFPVGVAYTVSQTNVVSTSTVTTHSNRVYSVPLREGTFVGTGDIGTVTSTMIADGTIVNGDINASAAIAYSKLSLSNSIVNGDIVNSTIQNAKLANSAITINSASTSLGGSVTLYAGTTALQTSSATQGLTGISSIEAPTTAGSENLRELIVKSADLAAASSVTGNVTVRSGDAADGESGNLTLKSGDSGADYSSGNVTLQAGSIQGNGGLAGTVSILGSSVSNIAIDGTAGNVRITGGKVVSTATGVAKNTGSVYIDGGGSGAGGTITYGSVFIGNQANDTENGTTRVTIGKSGTEVRLPGVGTSGFVKLGANGALSADTTVVTTTGTQTLTNKTLTSPKIDEIDDANGATAIQIVATASAVNYLTVANSAAGTGVLLEPAGTDANINLRLGVKGTANIIAQDTFQTNGAINLASAAVPRVSLRGMKPANITANTVTALDSWAIASNRSAKYYIQLTQGTKFYTCEIMVLHDGTTTTMSEYSVLAFPAATASQIPVTFTSDISGGNVRLLATVTDAATTAVAVEMQRTLILIQ